MSCISKLMPLFILPAATFCFMGCAQQSLDVPLEEVSESVDHQLDHTQPVAGDEPGISAERSGVEPTAQTNDEPPAPPRKSVVGSIFNALKNGAAGAVEESAAPAAD